MKWEVDVIETFETGRLAIRIWREARVGVISVLTPMMSDGKIGWGFVEAEEGEIVPVSLEIPMKGILDAMVTSLIEHGAKPKEDINKATVEAMADHLSDLKSIIFGSDKLLMERGNSNADI